MMLKLSDADLARLRLWCFGVEILRRVAARYAGDSYSDRDALDGADKLSSWCLRDREPEQE